MVLKRSHAIHIAPLVLVMAATICAADTHEHEHNTKQEAHVHGVAELTMVLENDTLEINLDSPAANIVGFEHRASSDEQKSAVDKAERILGSPNDLFTFTDAGCQPGQVDVDLSAVKEEHHSHDTDDHGEEHDSHDTHSDEEDHASHDTHSHGEDHASHDTHDHDEDDVQENEHHDTHSEITANYRFTCEQGSALTTVVFDILEYFPAIETLHVQWVTTAGQGAAEVSIDSRTVEIR